MPIGPFWIASIAVASVTALLSTGLLYTYAKNLRHAKTAFTVGLVLFAGAVVAQNVVAAFLYFLMAQTFHAGVAIPLLIINSVGLVAVSILVGVTLR